MIPAAISNGVTALQAAITAAAPLATSPSAAITVLQEQAETLLTQIGSTIPNEAGTLDGPDPTGMPPVLVAQFQALVGFAFDQQALVDLEGFVGRAATNLNQLGL